MAVRNMPLEKGDAKWQNGVQLKLKQKEVKQNVNFVITSSTKSFEAHHSSNNTWLR